MNTSVIYNSERVENDFIEGTRFLNQDQKELQMMYSTDSMTVSMETSLDMNDPDLMNTGETGGGKHFTLNTETDFLRVSIERGGQGERLRLIRSKSPSRYGSAGSKESGSTTKGSSSSSQQGSSDGSQEIDMWMDDLGIRPHSAKHLNDSPIKDDNGGYNTNLSKAVVAEDGYFPPEKNASSSAEWEVATTPGEHTKVLATCSEGTLHPKMQLSVADSSHCPSSRATRHSYEEIRDLHEVSSVHSLSDAVEHDLTESKRASTHSENDGGKETDSTDTTQACNFSGHKLALTGVGLYSILMECVGTPSWLNAGLTVGAAALITLDGVKKKRKHRKKASVLDMIKGHWNEEEKEEYRRKSTNQKRGKGIVVSALVQKFQKFWL